MKILGFFLICKLFLQLLEDDVQKYGHLREPLHFFNQVRHVFEPISFQTGLFSCLFKFLQMQLFFESFQLFFKHIHFFIFFLVIIIMNDGEILKILFKFFVLLI